MRRSALSLSPRPWLQMISSMRSEDVVGVGRNDYGAVSAPRCAPSNDALAKGRARIKGMMEISAHTLTPCPNMRRAAAMDLRRVYPTQSKSCLRRPARGWW